MTNYVIPAAPQVSVPVLGTDARFPVQRIYCVGRNYVEHAQEMGFTGREPPFFFIKPANTVVVVDAGVTATSALVAPFFANKNIDEPPHRALGVNLANGETYYYTAVPIPYNGEFSGVVVTGTSLRRLLPFIKNVALADIIIYSGKGQAIATTRTPTSIRTAS